MKTTGAFFPAVDIGHRAAKVVNAIERHRRNADDDRLNSEPRRKRFWLFGRLETREQVRQRLLADGWEFDFPCIDHWGTLDVARRITLLAANTTGNIFVSADEHEMLCQAETDLL